MLFCSESFLIFFVIVFSAYWLMPWPRARVGLLLAASFYFYACWNHWLAIIICVTTLFDYLIARGLDSARSERVRKGLLISSLAMNIGLLIYFKYANFFLESLAQTLNAMGASTSIPVLSVLLPIGISFYTFEAISYTVDVYRRKIPAEKNLANFMLFILFFPHLVAGPIVRARDFLPQTHRPKHWNWARLNLGVQFFIMGLFKKLAIADRMAIFADPVFNDPEQYRTGAIWTAVLAYAVQVYCDFSGYSDMALGTAHMLGYKLTKNFDMPFLAPNIADFWRRWHMSLSGWLRDYVFYPLGGSRGSGWQINRNLLITMTLCGLWHGSAWPFVAFGFLQGLMLIVHRYFRIYCETRPTLQAMLETRSGTTLRIALTLLAFCWTLAIFRAPTLEHGWTMWQRMIVPCFGATTPMQKFSFIVLLAIVAVCHLVASRDWWRRLALRLPTPILGGSYAVVWTAALVLAPEADKAFIYFQF